MACREHARWSAFDWLQGDALDVQNRDVAGWIAAYETDVVLNPIRGGDGEIRVALEYVGSGDDLVFTPDQSAGWKTAATMHRDDGTASALDGAGQIIGQAGEDAAGFT